VGEFRLEVREYHQDEARWRWVLTDAGGALVADHEVRLDPGCWQFEAFRDLLGYLDWHVAPDQAVEDEARVVGEVGAWIGEQVLGPVAAALVRKRPATVRVIVPEEARSLLFRPLELGHVGGVPLARQGVTLVMQLADDQDDAAVAPPSDRLRVLGLFSLPEGGQPLNLRRERHALVTLLNGIAAGGRAAEVRVLQYGVTREALRDVLQEGAGWDVIHISGHGAPGELLLETEAGQPDRVPAGDLAEMLELTRERVKLVTVSACWSAALTAAEQRRLLGLPVLEDSGSARASEQGREGGSSRATGTLATELAERLGCAVLGMRYPVVDDFAIELSGRLYDLLARQGQPLPRALGLALGDVMRTLGPDRCPALSAGTPALFGAWAAGLRLTAPERAEADSYATGSLKLAGFPEQPERFVGRTRVMAAASAALAADSGVPGVLLYGMPGGGKTACATELAYTHEHAFDRMVWFKAPDEGQDITGALTDFALTLELELPGFQMVHVLADEASLAGFVPRLTELVQRRRVLIAIDNIESLLSDGGEWRDDRWGSVVGALCGHRGLGRVVLTSRRRPAGLDGRVRVEAVDALSLDEALLLARELPNLRDLIRGDLAGVDPEVARRLALGVLDTAQGHPKLLELAEGQAADPARLSALVDAGDQAWQEAGGLPEGFFAEGESQADGEDYLGVLGAWTDAVAGGLGFGSRALFWFLCCLEEDDRIRPAAEANWGELWARLGRDSDPPSVEEGLARLSSRGLIAIRPETGQSNESYGIHPGIAAAARARAGKQFRDAVDAELAAFWQAVAGDAKEREATAGTTGLVVRAGLAAAPYLLRQEQWRAASYMLERAFERTQSRTTAALVLPALQAIAATGQVPDVAGVLAKVLWPIDPAMAERQTRAALAAHLDRGNYRGASAVTGELIDICRSNGRLAEALTLTEQKAVYTRQSGLGPWTQLIDEVWRLQVLNEIGRAEEVMAEVQRLRVHIQTLPAEPARDEPVYPWNIRETLLDTGRYAAVQLGRWTDALDLNAAIIASKRDRSALAHEVAQNRFNDYGPLVRLGRTDEALDLLLECREAFETAHDIRGIGLTLSALASIEDTRGRGEAAISLARDALRYKYLAGDVTAIANSYHNLGNHLGRHTRQLDAALACHLASSVIYTLAGVDRANQATRAAADDLCAAGTDIGLPADLTGLCEQVAGIPGADLNKLIATLAPEPGTVQQVLGELLALVRNLASAPPSADPSALAAWDPVIAALLAAVGDTRAAAELDAELDRCQDSPDWSALAAALRRLRAGDTGDDVLTGLDETDRAIVTRTLSIRDGRVSIPVELWPAIGLRWWLANVVAGTRGDEPAAARARQVIEQVAEDSGLSALAALFRRILDGERDPALGTGLDDPTLRAVVATALYHIGS
jgi:tetratricopeptide (TPR) repeat protein